MIKEVSEWCNMAEAYGGGLEVLDTRLAEAVDLNYRFRDDYPVHHVQIPTATTQPCFLAPTSLGVLRSTGHIMHQRQVQSQHQDSSDSTEPRHTFPKFSHSFQSQRGLSQHVHQA